MTDARIATRAAELARISWKPGKHGMPQAMDKIDELARQVAEAEAERDTGYKYLHRWQRWARRLSHAMGWCSRDVWPDDGQTRRRFVAALRQLADAKRGIHDGPVTGVESSLLDRITELEKCFAELERQLTEERETGAYNLMAAAVATDELAAAKALLNRCEPSALASDANLWTEVCAFLADPLSEEDP